MSSLVAADLSNNAFSGLLPREWSGMSSLVALNLMNNNLLSTIPEGEQGISEGPGALLVPPQYMLCLVVAGWRLSAGTMPSASVHRPGQRACMAKGEQLSDAAASLLLLLVMLMAML